MAASIRFDYVPARHLKCGRVCLVVQPSISDPNLLWRNQGRSLFPFGSSASNSVLRFVFSLDGALRGVMCGDQDGFDSCVVGGVASSLFITHFDFCYVSFSAYK